MTVIKRMVRLFKADLHGILDSLEEPEMIIKQAIREMEAEIEKDQGKLCHLKLNIESNLKQTDYKTKTLGQLEEEIAFSLKAQEEKITRGLIRKKLEVNKQISQLKKNKDELEISKDKLNEKIKNREEKLKEINDKFKLFVENKEQTSPGDEIKIPNCEVFVSEDEVNLAYLKAKEDFTTC